MTVFTFSVSDWKYPFWVKLVQKKSKLSVQAEIWHLAKFLYAELIGAVPFFCFRSEKPFLGKFGPRNQNFQFRLNFGTQTNLNMQNSMMMFTSPVFDRKYLFGQICSKKSKFSISAEIQYLDQFEYAEFNDGVHFSVFDRKYHFQANLVQKIKIFSLS